MQMKTKFDSCRTGDCKSVKQEVYGTVILPPFVFPEQTNESISVQIRFKRALLFLCVKRTKDTFTLTKFAFISVANFRFAQLLNK